MKIKYPIEHGNIKDFDDMKLIWNHVAKELKAPYKDVLSLSSDLIRDWMVRAESRAFY